jgi:hypothetical protein
LKKAHAKKSTFAERPESQEIVEQIEKYFPGILEKFADNSITSYQFAENTFTQPPGWLGNPPNLNIQLADSLQQDPAYNERGPFPCILSNSSISLVKSSVPSSVQSSIPSSDQSSIPSSVQSSLPTSVLSSSNNLTSPINVKESQPAHEPIFTDLLKSPIQLFSRSNSWNEQKKKSTHSTNFEENLRPHTAGKADSRLQHSHVSLNLVRDPKTQMINAVKSAVSLYSFYYFIFYFFLTFIYDNDRFFTKSWLSRI